MQLKSGTDIRKLQSLTELNVNCKSKFWMFITDDQLPQNIRCLSVEFLFFQVGCVPQWDTTRIFDNRIALACV